MKVAILGAGPSAAYIARACLDSGIRPDVYSDRMVKPLGGAFWLYWLPESVREYCAPQVIHVSGLGTAEHYAIKMWGEALPTSFPKEGEYKFPCYDPKEGLPALWGDLTVRQLTVTCDRDIEVLAQDYDLVFQTFPSWKSLEALREFRQPLYIWNRLATPTLGSSVANKVIYDGLAPEGQNGHRLRISNIFGYTSIEYARNLTDIELAAKPSGGRLVQGWKLHPQTPLWEAAPADNVVLVGRFSQWNRKLLSHDSYTVSKRLLGSSSPNSGISSLTSTVG